MMHEYGMMGTPMWIYMPLLWGFAILGLVCLVRWLISHTGHHEPKSKQDSRAQKL